MYCRRNHDGCKTYGGDQDHIPRTDGLMRARSGDLRGIVNGIGDDVFNPETDPEIVMTITT